MAPLMPSCPVPSYSLQVILISPGISIHFSDKSVRDMISFTPTRVLRQFSSMARESTEGGRGERGSMNPPLHSAFANALRNMNSLRKTLLTAFFCRLSHSPTNFLLLCVLLRHLHHETSNSLEWRLCWQEKLLPTSYTLLNRRTPSPTILSI
jgi:hypothetical protein